MADNLIFFGQGIEAAITSTNGIEAASSLSAYPASNILDRNQRAISITASADSGTWFIKFDMGANYTASGIALINANPYTGGLYSGTKWTLGLIRANNWNMTGYTVVTLSGASLPTAADEPYFYRAFTTSHTDRYWRVECYVIKYGVSQIGYICLGQPYIIDIPYNRPRPMRSSYGLKMSESKGGHRSSTLYYENRKIWTRADFDVLSSSDWEDIFQYLWTETKGGHYPCLFKDVDDTYHWIRVNAGSGNLDYQESMNHFFQASFVFEEEI